MPNKKTIITGISSISILFPIILLCGCINLGGFFAASVSTNTVHKSSDLLVIKNIKVVPQKVYAGTKFTLYFTVKHIGDPRTSDAVIYSLRAYDFGICKPITQTDMGTQEIQPGEEKEYSISLQAPSNSEMADLEAHCPIRIRLTYENVKARTQVEAYVMSEERMKTLQRNGKFQNYVPTQKVGIGPVKIYFEFLQNQPFIAGENVVFFVYAKNEGDGDVENGKILVNVRVAGGYSICSAELSFIGDETNKVKCTWVPSINGDEKMLYLIAEATYDYSFEKTEDVTVYPLPQ